MNNLLIKNFLYYSIILLPFTYIFGIFITELFLSLIIIFFFIKNRNTEYFFDKKFIFLLLISLYIGLNGFFQIDDNLRVSSIFHFHADVYVYGCFYFFHFYFNLMFMFYSLYRISFFIS